MSIARELFDLRIGGAYLPSLILIVLDPDLQYVHVLSVFCLLGAVYFHGLSRHIFGVGGPEENPLPIEEVLRRWKIAVFGKEVDGNSPDPSASTLVQVRKAISSVGQILFIIVGIISIILWIPGIVISLYYGIVELGGESVGIQIAIFAEVVWVTQWLVWRFFNSPYLTESDEFE